MMGWWEHNFNKARSWVVHLPEKRRSVGSGHQEKHQELQSHSPEHLLIVRGKHDFVSLPKASYHDSSWVVCASAYLNKSIGILAARVSSIVSRTESRIMTCASAIKSSTDTLLKSSTAWFSKVFWELGAFWVLLLYPSVFSRGQIWEHTVVFDRPKKNMAVS